ncbi:MAG: DUF1553 domain-containing protein [Verrucomicrobiales bacterium]|nr:DUF1553 domain-containing protein [Verrucomicrobiales bacterium]
MRPILSDKCFKCHGPDSKNQKSSFRIDTFEEATKSHDGYVGVTPGDLEKSEVHHRIHTDDPGDLMPPPKSKMALTAEEKKTLDQWIKEGGTYEKHWSLNELPAEIPVPEMEGVTNPVDRFIRKELQNRKMTHSPPAPPEKWLRRVTFDLTGLPPSIEEIDAFLSDSSPEKYQKVVDRLLNSTAYAERMTSEWLDVARYSDTYGFQVDRNREVWPWRDWVVQSFQNNLSYDKFITWQVAGDLLPDATRDQILATTFNRLHPQKVEGGSVEEEFRIEYVADRVHTFGTAFMGLTMECCRCHDHKYDPISQKDYYSLSAFFSNIDEAGLYSYFTPSVPTPTLELPTEKQEADLKAARLEVGKLEQQIEELKSGALEAYKTWKMNFPLDKNGLVAHLDFEGNAKNQFPNLVDPKSPAKTTAENILVPGKVGKAVQLSGDDAINLPSGVGNFTRDQPFSVALWLKTPDLKERAVIFRRSKAWTDAASRGYEMLLEDGKPSAALVHFYPGNAIRVRARDPLPVNEWHHLAMTYDGSSRADGLKIYIDGTAIETEVVRDNLSREIVGGGDDFIGLGQRMRDRGFKNGLVDEFYVYDREITAIEAMSLCDPEKSASLVDSERFDYFLSTAYPPMQELFASLRKAREKRSKIRKGIREIMVMRELPGEPKPAYILDRGVYDARAEPVSPQTPSALPPIEVENPNRLDLAQWLTSNDHPLTARVAVNRYWQMMFGRGLVSTSEDFGSQGRLPSHPELLDWLARDFIAHGWDLHHLFRRIVLSETYRQSSAVSSSQRERDPENIWLARSPSYKLPAEMIRDNALAVSGLLSDNVGEAAVKPYDLNVSFKPIKPDAGEKLYRRSVYTFWKQTGPSPLMMTLDASKRDVCRVKREQTASPLQSLVLLNSPQFIEAARVTAENLIENYSDDNTAIIEECFRLFTSRSPDQRELEILNHLIAEQAAIFESSPDKAKDYLKTGSKKASDKFDPARVAVVTQLVSTLMNFDESITKR